MSEVIALETERKEKFPELQEWNQLLNNDCNRTAENIAKRVALRERIAAIDKRLKELNAA